MLQVGYWQADRCAFSVYPWTADGNLAAQELLFAPTWAVLKNVPPQLYSLKGISVVASAIGEPLHTEKSRLDPYHFGDTKVKVEINLSHPPPDVVIVKDTQGNSVKINVDYPSLPPKCINCGKFGHLMNRCNKPHMKRVPYQKKEKVISVTKADIEIKPAVDSEVEGQEVQEEVRKKKKRSSRSRSRRRSRSREKARALSSPPENVDSKVIDAQVVESKVARWGDDLEEGEIGKEGVSMFEEEERVKQSKEEIRGEGVQLSQFDPGALEDEDNGVWFTKHSRAYRRMLRQKASCEANGGNFRPSSSSSFLIRGSSSDRKPSF